MNKKVNPEPDCVACCGGPIFAYKYNDEAVKLTDLPITAFKRNGLQDNVFTEQGTIRYLCQVPTKPCCCPPKAEEPIKTRNPHDRHHNCCKKVNCAHPPLPQNCCANVPVWDNNYEHLKKEPHAHKAPIYEETRHNTKQQCDCNHTMPIEF